VSTLHQQAPHLLVYVSRSEIDSRRAIDCGNNPALCHDPGRALPAT
jgi:hypothetical protein